MQEEKKHGILTKQEVIDLKKNYTLTNKKEYPNVQSLGNGVFRYTDEIKISEQSIFILFLCTKNGLPIGKVANTYFDYSDMPNITNQNWLAEYKKRFIKSYYRRLRK